MDDTLQTKGSRIKQTAIVLVKGSKFQVIDPRFVLAWGVGCIFQVSADKGIFNSLSNPFSRPNVAENGAPSKAIIVHAEAGSRLV